jgi:hypothetical protein
MQSSFYRRTLPKLIFAIVALTIGVFMSGGQQSANAAFNARTLVTLSSSATSANADTTFQLDIDQGDYNFSAVINSTPAAATVTAGPTVDGAASQGEVVGTLSSSVKLGLTNGSCGSSVTVTFTFINATVDNTDVIAPVPQASTNTSDGGVLANQWSDAGDSTSPAGTHLADAPWNDAGGKTDEAGTLGPALTVAEQANGLPAQVDDYPFYLNRVFDPDSSVGDPFDGTDPVQPLARYAGASNVNGSATILNLVIFGPNVLADAFPPPHPFADLRDVGYTSVAVLNNPSQEAAPSAITDFCSGLATTTSIFGMTRDNACEGVTTAPCNTPEGISKPCTFATCPGLSTTGVRYANPAAGGTGYFVSFQQSLRDKDGDGFENALDTCPDNVDTYDYRQVETVGLEPGDSDDDGIPTVSGAAGCDTNGSTSDEADGDGWFNTGDNCPRFSNATATETELTTAYSVTAPRGGPRTDGIGDGCDGDDTNGNGIIGGGETARNTTAEGDFETSLTLIPKCFDSGPEVDADGDGFCTTGTPSDPNDAIACDYSPPIAPGGCAEDYDLVYAMGIAHSGSGLTPPMRQPAQICNDGIDNDGDTLVDNLDVGVGNSTCRPKNLTAHPNYPTCPTAGCPGIDTDGDGYTDEAERHVGTDALARCDVTAAAPSGGWPSDLDDASGTSTNKLTLTDLTSFLAPTRRLGTSPGNANYSQRFDLVPGASSGEWIQLDDMTSLLAGATSTPPMFSSGTSRAFNDATKVCTAHPTYGD